MSSPSPSAPAPSAPALSTLPLSRRAAAVRGSAIRDLLALTARPDVISLAGGLPAPELLPRERIASAAAEALTGAGSLQYGETAGLARLRAVLAAQESERCGRVIEPAAVVVTSGSQQALDLVARAVLDPGDTVIVEDPATSAHCRPSRRRAPR